MEELNEDNLVNSCKLAKTSKLEDSLKTNGEIKYVENSKNDSHEYPLNEKPFENDLFTKETNEEKKNESDLDEDLKFF